MNFEELALRTTLSLPYQETLAQVVAALQEEGFGVLTEIDVKATFKKKLDADFRKYAILGACNPPLAHQALSTAVDIGLLLPCNVIVYEDGDKSVVAIIDPMSMLGVVDDPDLEPVAQEARTRLGRVIEALDKVENH